MKKGGDGGAGGGTTTHGRPLSGEAVALCSVEGMEGCAVGYASGAIEVFFGDGARFSAMVSEAPAGSKAVVWLTAHVASGGELIVAAVTADGSLVLSRMGFGADRLSSLRTHRIPSAVPVAAPGSRAFAFAFEPASRLFATVSRDGTVVQSQMDVSLSSAALSSAEPLKLTGLASLVPPPATAGDGERGRAVAKRKAPVSDGAAAKGESVSQLREVAAAFLPSGLLAVLGLDASSGQPRLLIVNALFGIVMDVIELEMEAPARGSHVALLTLAASGTIALACGGVCIAELPIPELSSSLAAAMDAASSDAHSKWSAPAKLEAPAPTAAVSGALSELEGALLTDSAVDKVLAEIHANTLSFGEIDRLVRAAGARAVTEGPGGGKPPVGKPSSKKQQPPQQQQQRRPPAATTLSSPSTPARRLFSSLLASRKVSLSSCEGIFKGVCIAGDLELLEALVLGLPDITESMLVAAMQVILAADGLAVAERDSYLLAVMSRRKNEVLMLQALRSLSRPQVLALLNFSRGIAEHYAANPSRPNIVEGKGSFARDGRPQASLRQILDWTTHILDSRFAELVLMPECHQTVISLAAAIEDNKRISEQMQVVQGHVNNIANGKAFASKAKAKIPDYVVEYLEV